MTSITRVQVVRTALQTVFATLYLLHITGTEIHSIHSNKHLITYIFNISVSIVHDDQLKSVPWLHSGCKVFYANIPIENTVWPLLDFHSASSERQY